MARRLIAGYFLSKFCYIILHNIVEKSLVKQEKTMLEETIAAIATPPGEGGIGIIRISGMMPKVF